MHFFQHDEKTFHKITRASIEEALQLNGVLDNNDSDEWCGPKPWLHLFHCASEEVLVTHRNTNNWENREGIDRHDSISRTKKNLARLQQI